MKRLCVLLVTALVTACSQTPVAASATLVGAHDMVLVDKLLFTTSTDRDELRALDLAPVGGLGTRAYVRAPNPLEALSIPVLGRPSALARDTHFEDTVNPADGGTVPLGREVGGPWVYATRAGGSEISIVGGGPASDLTQLVEVKRLPTSAPVTASAGVSLSKDLSRLYFATFDGEAATLQSIDLPGSVAALKVLPPAALTKTVRVFPPYAGEVIVEVLVVPPVAGRGICELPGRSCLILATRTRQGEAGRVVLLDPQTLEVRELRFPGPIRLLATHSGTFAAGTYIPPGRRVFGVLSEERCGGADCGGVVAVDTFTGEVALDGAGLPMIPIPVGNSLPTGLAVVARGELLLPPYLVNQGTATVPTVVAVSAVGVITTSNGSFIFFDANGLMPFDLDVTSAYANPLNVGLYRPDGVLNAGDAGVSAYVEGPVFDADAGIGIRLANGAWHSEVIDIVVNGLIPGLEDLPFSSPTSLEFALPEGLAQRVEVGDLLVFKTPLGSCRGTVSGVTATSLKAAALNEILCSGRSRFAVRAGGANRYVVVATVTGYLGRTGPERTFSYKGAYLRRSLPFDASAPTFAVVLGKETPRLEEDWRWSIDVQPAEIPFLMRIDSQSVGCSTNVASSVLWDLDRQAIFSIFPSANAIVEVNPSTAYNGTLVSNGQCWR